MLRAFWNKLTGSKPVAATHAVQMPRTNRKQTVGTTQDILAEYDAAQTTNHNSRHWANSDSLSADGANSVDVRKALRNRARYEAQENNSYAKGIVLTLANDTIGTGPRLQVTTTNSRNNQRIEQAFASWARKTNLAKKLRTMRLAKVVDGEAFCQFVTNERLDSPVQLDLVLIEADQISTPLAIFSPNAVDGVKFDKFGNPTEYHRLKHHPGGTYYSGLEFDTVPAEAIIHMFRCDRPGQHRGVPEITPALPLFAHLRRFTLATIDAAETAATFAGIMYTDSAAITSPDNVEAMDAIELERNAMLTLPKGWRMGQMKAEHPGTTYDMFVSKILNEIARCLNMPYNIAAGNSSGYNFASGRLDHQTYFKAIAVERCEWEISCIDRIFSAWFDEAVLVPGLLPGNMGAMLEVPHSWHWDGREHVDPKKEADATAVRLASGTTTYAREFASQGLDWEQEMSNQADALGLGIDEYREVLIAKLFAISPTATPEEEQEEQEEQEVLDDEEE
jgi:lambda family phage portal protein